MICQLMSEDVLNMQDKLWNHETNSDSFLWGAKARKYVIITFFTVPKMDGDLREDR